MHCSTVLINPGTAADFDEWPLVLVAHDLPKQGAVGVVAADSHSSAKETSPEVWLVPDLPAAGKSTEAGLFK